MWICPNTILSPIHQNYAESGISISAASSISEPRPPLATIAVGFRSTSRRRLKRFRVAGVSGRQPNTRSICGRQASRSSSVWRWA